MRRLLVIASVFASACGSSPVPTVPTVVAPPIPACQANNTASITFGNRSAGTTQTVFWDGLGVATLTPGQNSGAITAAAGVAHRLETRITNSSLLACAISNPVPAQCSAPLYTCAFP